jgi:hypothetical protein
MIEEVEVTEEVLLDMFDSLIKRHKQTIGVDEKLDLVIQVVFLIFMYFRFKVGNDLLFSIERDNR